MEKKNIPLNELKVGQRGIVSQLLSDTSMRRRLQDIGLIEGTKVECIQKSPSGDPIAFLIRGAVIALRTEDSSSVLMSLS
ncbi:MAG: ferrous iron transport protein A [Clostridium sp.]|nr:ferrous iron transport protein A [Clostridium sp.]